MPTIYQFPLPGSPWADASSQIKEEICVATTHGISYKLADIFRYITLADSNRELEEKLVARGAFEPIGGPEFINRGTPITSALADLANELGRISLYIPREVPVSLLIEGRILRLKFSTEAKNQIVVAFRDRPPTAGFGRRFVLSEVRFEDAGVFYDLVDLSDSGRVFQLFVDYLKGSELALALRAAMSGDPAAGGEAFPSHHLVSRRYGPGSILRNDIFMDGPCHTPNPGPQIPCDDSGGTQRVKIHAKILYNPKISIANQLNAMNRVFAVADLTVELVSTEIVNRPDLLDYNAGACTNVSSSPHQEAISRYRANVGPNEIAVYWVRNISGNNSWLAGCASSPPGKPMAVMAYNTSEWVLAHELGHLMNLNHTPKEPAYQTRLMYPQDSFQGQPIIVPGEQKTARCSKYSL